MKKTQTRPALALLTAILLLLLAASSALAAPSALAAGDVSTRVQSLTREVSAPTLYNVPNDLTVTDSAANEIVCGEANSLGALYLASQATGFDFVTSWGGKFIDSIAGSGGAPDWESWWSITINGWFTDVGVYDFHLQDGDTLVFCEIDMADREAPFTGAQLVVEGPRTVGVASVATFRVLADDLSLANSAADATRFGLDPATAVQTPAQFVPVAGATLHVGPDTYVTDENGEVTVQALGLGLHRVWAQKDFDTDFFYVPSSPSHTVVVPFSDVAAPTDPYYEAIHVIAGAGIVNGYTFPEGAEFRPSNPLWRAQFAKMICLALGLDVQPDTTCPFGDLGDRSKEDYLYPHDYVATAFQNDIIYGKTPTRFGTYDNVTRTQVVTMVVRAVNSMFPTLLKQPSTDYVSTWGNNYSTVHAPNSRVAEYNGLLAGLPLEGAASDPWAPMPRGETAQVLYNALMLLAPLAGE